MAKISSGTFEAPARNRKRSMEAFERAKQSLAGGVSSAAKLGHQPFL